MNQDQLRELLSECRPDMGPKAFVEVCWKIIILDRSAKTETQQQTMAKLIRLVLARLQGCGGENL